MLGFSGFPRQTIVPAAARLAGVHPWCERCPCTSLSSDGRIGAAIRVEEVEFAQDSPLEGTGFEPLVPRKAPEVLVLFRLIARFMVNLSTNLS
jgi:hypothetical protein